MQKISERLEEISEYSLEQLNDLFQEEWQTSQGFGIAGRDLKTVSDWLKANRETIRDILQRSAVVSCYLESPRIHKRIVIVAAIADLISSLVWGVAGFVVAELILREGLETFLGNSVN